MFVGHYAASLVLKRVDKNVSLGLLFLAVQFVDLLFFPFVLMGIEKFSIFENYTESTHFILEFMPFTHSLFASLLWAAAIYIVFRFFPSKSSTNKKKIALILAIAVLSHWFMDLIVHTPDLPLLSDSSIKIGLGLWNNDIATYVLETILLLIGLRLYLKSTKGTAFIGKYGMIIFVAIMILINANNIFGPPFGEDVLTMSLSAIMMYLFFAGVAFWLDRKRS